MRQHASEGGRRDAPLVLALGLMVLDSSAVLAVLFDEPQRRAFTVSIERDQRRLMSAGNVLESALLAEARRGEAAGRELDLLMHRAEVQVVPVDSEQVEFARSAWRRYGKGRHPAGLNFGDCFAYALAAASGEPLLFAGEDFRRTDIAVVEVEESPVIPATPPSDQPSRPETSLDSQVPGWLLG